MLTVVVYNTSANKKTTISLPSKVFAAKVNQALMSQAVRIYLSNQRQAPAKTKRRGEINLSGRKIYRQKGTGRARHGDRKAPIFIKGAKAHGPTGGQNFKLKLSKKMKRLALFSALTSKLKDKKLIIIDGLEEIEPKTKNIDKILKKFKLSDSKKKTKITIVLDKVLDNVIRAGRNISYLSLKQVKQLNTYEVLNGGYLFFTKESIDLLKKNYGSK